jgi:putative transcriptional regulator
VKSLKSHLLVAAPSLLTPFFTRTVILMLEHNEEGAVGVVLNRPTEATLTDVAEQVFQEPFDWAKPINLGGPVPGPLLVLHTLEGLADQEVLTGIYSTAAAEKVEQIVRQKAEPSLIVANYAGWGPGQLEGEMREDAWLTAPARAELVFWDGAADLWDVVVKAIGASELSKILGLRDLPPDPSLN